MGKIRVLSDQVASQVAAGEVVERPASLVKELVENSLDAGASRISVEFARGGSRLVAVQDDGSGMDREDALLCLERHATSKIRDAADLVRVRSMGFRGEALPSIASVSRFRMVTREASSESGTEVLVEGGRVETVRETGAPVGTLIEVRDLFFNVPARRKFLRGEETESSHILHGLQAIALANPRVAMECRRDGAAVFAYPRADSLAVRIRDLFGASHLSRLGEIPVTDIDGIRLSGYLARPGQGRRDRLHQFVFLNGRPVQCPAVQQPLREAYADALERGTHPICVLCIEMDPELVDCNVHPAKREVRLSRPDALKRAVFDAARAVIAPARAVPPAPPAAPSSVRASAPAPAPVVDRRPVTPERVFMPEPSQRDFALRREPERPVLPEPRRDGSGPEHSPPAVEAPVGPERRPVAVPKDEPPDTFRYLGCVGEGFVVLEGAEGLVILDARSARERVLYETLMREMASGTVPCQRLLLPVVVDFPGREHAWISEHLDEVRAAGFLVEPFGGTTLKIEGLPASAGEGDPERLLHGVASAVRSAGKIPRGHGVREALARSVSRLASAEAAVDADHAPRLVRELLRCELPYASPSGRPTMIQFSHAELARKFGRSG